MIESIRKKMKILALADAIIEPEWQYRYFSYNSKWSDEEEMASLRDGCGGEWFLWLSGPFAGYKCLSPEDGLMPNLDGVKSHVPNGYSSFLSEPAFSMNLATCIWYWHDSKWFKHGLTVERLIDLEDIRKWTLKIITLGQLSIMIESSILKILRNYLSINLVKNVRKN